MKRLLSYLRPYRKECVVSPLFKLLEAVFDLLVPIVVKSIIDNGIAKDDRSYLFWMIGLLAVFAVVGLACALTAQYFAARAAVGFSADLRCDLFAAIGKFTYTETDRAGTSTLITRMTADVDQLQSGINLSLRLLLRSPIIVFGAMIMAFTVNVRAALVFVLVIPLLSAVVFTVMLRSIPRHKEVRASLDRVTGLTRENLTGVRVLRAFRKEEEEIRRFAEANAKQERLQNAVGKLSALLNPLSLLLVDFGIILLLRSGATLVSVGDMTQGDVVALTNYMAQILVELVKFATTILSVNKALACAPRICKVLETPQGLPIAEDASPADETTAVAFENVSLTYAGNAAPSLSEISFRVPRGATVGIIGSTGSGKTSVAGLIPRFYDATGGTVRLFGRDVRSYPVGELRKRVSAVPQKATLFRGTVRSNLLWGDPGATDEQLWAALEAAQAKDFVSALPQGLDAPVEQGGKNFSGGQRQRLTIARALVGNADILILDDSSSALDYATDASLRKALRNLPGSPTVFLISQRTNSIRHADLILVLDEGKPAGLGTHEELLRSSPVYREIYESQFRKDGETA